MSEQVNPTDTARVSSRAAPGDVGDRTLPEPPAKVYLQPIASPSILGLYGFAGATFMVAASMARWFYNAHAPVGIYLFPFVGIFGGLAQLLAGMWAYKARDGLATAVHGTWGSFWIAYGVLYAFVAAGKINLPASGLSAPLGYWFIVLAVITLAATVAAVGENGGLFMVLAWLTAGSIAAAIANLVGSDKWLVLGGWLLIVSAAAAFYTASGMMINASLGRTVLPLYDFPRQRQAPKANAGIGEPGVQHGQ